MLIAQADIKKKKTIARLTMWTMKHLPDFALIVHVLTQRLTTTKVIADLLTLLMIINDLTYNLQKEYLCL